MDRLGTNQKKILLLLLTGAALCVNTSPRTANWIIASAIRDWRKINRQSLERSLSSLEKHKYIVFQKKGKVFFPLLTAKGRQQAFFADLQNLEIKIPKQWDGNWRVVLFDVPEDHKEIRHFLRTHLKRLGFYKLQKSVFVHAYDCRKEMEKISGYYGNGEYIRFIEAYRIDNEEKIKKYFRLC